LKNSASSRLLAISDIHGHQEGLELLLHKAGYKPAADQLVLLGDYIDKDPLTWSTLAYVKKLVEEGAQAVPGNLEMGLLAQLAAHGDGLDRFEAAVRGKGVLDWLTQLPAYIVSTPYLFVHAGVRPGVPLSEQSMKDMTEIREDFWGAEAQATGYTVVFGHTPTFKLGAPDGQIWRRPGKIGIDTGAKHGCRLTLLDLQEGTSYSCSTATDSLYKDVQIRSV